MYTILITESNELVTSEKERIMQRNKLVDNLRFLMNPVYKEVEMSDATVIMEYILPVSKEYCTETLVLSDDLFEDNLMYVLPFDTNLTKEAGNVEISISIYKVDLDTDGTSIQRVRHVSPTTITILPIMAWCDVIPDSALTALDQRLIKTEALIKAANELNESLINSKADDLSYEDNTLQLLANGEKIGNPAKITSGDGCDCTENEGMKVVEF